MKIYLLIGSVITIIFLLSLFYYITRDKSEYEDVKGIYGEMESLIGAKATILSFMILLTFFYPFVLSGAFYMAIKEKKNSK